MYNWKVWIWGMGVLFVWAACGQEKKEIIDSAQNFKKVVVDESVPDSLYGIPGEIVGLCRTTDGFDFPVGKPDANNYQKARGIIQNEHMGEDWNGVAGADTDYGDLIYAVADGVVFYAEEYRPGWGTVVRILHNAGTKEAPEYIESLYAHLASNWVKPGVFLRRGAPLGTIGDADIYHAHLHFEMRSKPNMPIPWSEGAELTEFVNPSEYIASHRPEKVLSKGDSRGKKPK